MSDVIQISHYLTASGQDVFDSWLTSLRDANAGARIVLRITRVAAGNFGDCKPLRDGVWELRVDWGPGYRVYYGRAGTEVVILLCGGDKRKQTADIARAVAYWNDYKRRTAKP